MPTNHRLYWFRQRLITGKQSICHYLNPKHVYLIRIEIMLFRRRTQSQQLWIPIERDERTKQTKMVRSNFNCMICSNYRGSSWRPFSSIESIARCNICKFSWAGGPAFGCPEPSGGPYARGRYKSYYFLRIHFEVGWTSTLKFIPWIWLRESKAFSLNWIAWANNLSEQIKYHSLTRNHQHYTELQIFQNSKLINIRFSKWIFKINFWFSTRIPSLQNQLIF